MEQKELNKLKQLKDTLNKQMTHDEVKIYEKIKSGLSKTHYNNEQYDWNNRDYRRAEVFYADLSGNLGSEQGNGENGLRPVVIIQNDIGNKYSPTTIVAVLTSKLTKAKIPTHLELMSDEYNLPKNSIALFEQIRTLDKRRLKSKICYLGDDMQKKLDNAVIISMTNASPKSLLERLPDNMKNYIITSLKQIKRKEIQMKEMKNDGFDEPDIKKVFEKKMNILKQFIAYCKNHQLDYEKFYVLNKGITDEVNKSELIAL
jgi:mRNA interferase MazF